MNLERDYQSVLVCGGRNYSDASRVNGVLDELVIGEIIHGGAAGADLLGLEYAIRHHIKHREFKPNWTTYGRAAGPIRNERMLHEGQPDVVVAFPGGRGTADMVRRAKARHIKVIEVSG